MRGITYGIDLLFTKCPVAQVSQDGNGIVPAIDNQQIVGPVAVDIFRDDRGRVVSGNVDLRRSVSSVAQVSHDRYEIIARHLASLVPVRGFDL